MENNTLMIIGGGLTIMIIIIFLVYNHFKSRSSENFEAGYFTLDKNDPVSSNMPSNGVLAILAPWCGYCKKMKESKILDKVSEKVPVVEIDDKHEDCVEIMKNNKAPGFPSLILVRNGQMSLYNGDRSVEGILKHFN